MSTMVVKPQLVDLYCTTGQPDKALELLGLGSVEDPSLGSEPGAAAFRQGLVYMLLGNYMSTDTLWSQRSIPRVRFQRTGQLLDAGLLAVRGNAMHGNQYLLDVPHDHRAASQLGIRPGHVPARGGLPLPDGARRPSTSPRP